MVDVAADIAFAPGAVRAGIAALEAGAPILCDSKMVANGITRARLPRDNAVICTLDAPEVPALAARLGTTRTAAGDGVVARPARRRRGSDRQRADGACSGCWNCSTRARRTRPASSACRSASSARRNQKTALMADGRVPYLVHARSQRRQRDDRRHGQRPREPAGMTAPANRPPLRHRPWPGRPGTADRQGGAAASRRHR